MFVDIVLRIVERCETSDFKCFHGTNIIRNLIIIDILKHKYEYIIPFQGIITSIAIVQRLIFYNLPHLSNSDINLYIMYYRILGIMGLSYLFPDKQCNFLFLPY
jgi:hypothetical protein